MSGGARWQGDLFGAFHPEDDATRMHERAPELEPALEREGRAGRRDVVVVRGVILRNLGDVIVWMTPLSLTMDDAELRAAATRAASVEACAAVPTS